MEFSIDKQQKGIDKTIEMAFDILNKAIEHRTDEEDKWLKLHGGSQRFRGYGSLLKSSRYKPTRADGKRCLNGLLLHMNSNTFNDLVRINNIFMGIVRWDLSKTKEDKEYFENIQKKLLQAKEFLNIEYPIPIKDIDLTIEKIKKLKKEWKKLNKEIIYEHVNQKEKLKLIKKYKIDSNLSFDEVKEESEKIKLTRKYKIDSNLTLEEVKKVVDSKIRKKLGIGENVNSDLSKELIEKINRNIKNIKSEEGYLYIRTWKVSGNTQWYKIGITNDLERRESEQNVLPVAAKTLATAKVASMEHARTIEQSIHKTIEKFKIKNANNRELFKLKPDELASLIEVFKKIDLSKK